MTVEALGQIWTLKLSTNALCEIEDELGKGIDQIGVLLQDPAQGRVKLFRLIVWAALSDHHENVSQKTAGMIIDEIGMSEVLGLIQRLLTLAMPEPKKGAAGSPRNASLPKAGGARS
jgi:hypothetical protein